MDKEEVTIIQTNIPIDVTLEETNIIHSHINEITDKFINSVVKEKDMLLAQELVKQQKNKMKELQHRVTELENIIKEAKKIPEEMLQILFHYEDRKVFEDLLSILNKANIEEGDGSIEK